MTSMGPRPGISLKTARTSWSATLHGAGLMSPTTSRCSVTNPTRRELTPEEIEAAAQLAGLILAGIVIGIEAAAPHVRRWWSSSVVPWGKTVRARVSAAVKKFRKEKPQAGFVEEAMFVASSTGVVLARPDEIRMTSAEWERRFRSMLVADAFAQEQMRVLSIARVNDRQTVLQEPSESEVLTATQFVERVKLMLEANPSLLNSETSTALMQVFDPRNGLPREL